MVQVIPTHIKEVWDAWNIRGMVLLSLSIQTILTIFAPLRKRTSNRFLVVVLWLSYLFADWSANFAVGLIAKNQGKESKPEDPPHDQNLMALWAPFLLLHLGGPDTITAYSLEDNALWNRHFLSLALQAISGAYVVIQSLPNTLWVIILLMFIAGTFKYLERTIALYLASSDKFRGSILKVSSFVSNDTHRTNNSTDVYARQNGLPRRFSLFRDLKHLDILQHAFWFFNNFRSLVVSNIFTFEQRKESREFFRSLEPKKALMIFEVELGLIYDGLYTKVSVLHTWIGAVTRTIALGSLWSAFCIFHYRPQKSHEFHGADIVITYTLFLVGIVLDTTSLLMALPSDWTFAVLSRLNKDKTNTVSRRIDITLNWFLGLKKLRWKKKTCCKGIIEHEVLDTPFLLQRWAGSIKMFNFIAYSLKTDIERIYGNNGRTCMQEWKEKVIAFIYQFESCKRIAIWINELHQYIREAINRWSNKKSVAHYIVVRFPSMIFHFFGNLLGINNLLDYIILVRSVHSEPLTKELWEFIFTQLRLIRSEGESVDGWKEWAPLNTEIKRADLKKLLPYIVDVDYDQSLIMWHIATELCYQQETPSTKENCNNRVFSKIISDYMMYLLIMQPKLMSEVAGIGKIRFRHTLAEAEKFYKRRHIKVESASSEILKVRTEIDSRDVKGNQSKSVLFEASALAKKLNKLTDRGENKWAVVSQMWMVLLSYAAKNCMATARMEQLSKGGELLNFVWLAMAHLGLVDDISSLQRTNKLVLCENKSYSRFDYLGEHF